MCAWKREGKGEGQKKKKKGEALIGDDVAAESTNSPRTGMHQPSETCPQELWLAQLEMWLVLDEFGTVPRIHRRISGSPRINARPCVSGSLLLSHLPHHFTSPHICAGLRQQNTRFWKNTNEPSRFCEENTFHIWVSISLSESSFIRGCLQPHHAVKYTTMYPIQLPTTPIAVYALVNMSGRNS